MTETSSGKIPSTLSVLLTPKASNVSVLGELSRLMSDTRSLLALTILKTRIYNLEIGQITIGIAEALETMRLVSITFYPLQYALADQQSTGPNLSVSDILTQTLFQNFVAVAPTGPVFDVNQLPIIPVSTVFDDIKQRLADLDIKSP